MHGVRAGVTIMSVGRLIVLPLEARPLCSIVIPCLNEARDHDAVVRGAMEQRYPPHQLEILVADGGSTDGTREIVARLAEKDAGTARRQPRAVSLGGDERGDPSRPRDGDRADGCARGVLRAGVGRASLDYSRRRQGEIGPHFDASRIPDRCDA